MSHIWYLLLLPAAGNLFHLSRFFQSLFISPPKRYSWRPPVLLCSFWDGRHFKYAFVGHKTFSSTEHGSWWSRLQRQVGQGFQSWNHWLWCNMYHMQQLHILTFFGSFKVRRRTKRGIRIIDILGACKNDTTWLAVAANWPFITTNGF